MDLAPVRARLVRRFGPDIHDWVDLVPDRVAELADRWGLKVGEPYGTGNTSVVFRCDAGVLKVSPQVEFTAEQVRTLQLFEPTGRVPKVLMHADGAVLMETIEPGEPVVTPPPLDDYAQFLRDLRTPATEGPRHLAEGTEEIFVRVEQRGVDVGDARRIRDELVSSQTEQVLLHGDLHLFNVLNGPKLMAIDPKACLGDPCFDAVDYALATKRSEDLLAGSSIIAAVAKAADLDVDRLAAWCRVFAWMS
ncbi:aminoglycoside phosphotransferase family protein [Actinocrispum wychmicini]|uniref:Streptomycin 6-kinase n=1 Tax=Actinocrispum wychmicini TaxID=1213861 RepID=A0A4R2ITZ8_9PSEU|nr:aminoglycoside phosphotransferase family protein [Actinocrispum wychmicini]TCO48102.1 streptomycin 6-kinase [Actinocrispum wychmicini]